MMDSPLYKAVAALGEVYDGSAHPEETPSNWARAVAGVAAVLQAIETPSASMKGAGADALLEHGVDIFIDGRETEFCWKAMLAALTDEAPTLGQSAS